MSATNQETVTVSRDTIVDLIAALQAAADLVVIEDDRFARRFSREECSDAIGLKADEFRLGLLGPSPDDDDAYATDPTLVELMARHSEFEAEMIAACMQRRVRGAETRARLEAADGHSAKLLEYAKRIRDTGNTDAVKFPTDAEMMEKARLAMNAAKEAGDDAR